MLLWRLTVLIASQFLKYLVLFIISPSHPDTWDKGCNEISWEKNWEKLKGINQNFKHEGDQDWNNKEFYVKVLNEGMVTWRLKTCISVITSNMKKSLFYSRARLLHSTNVLKRTIQEVKRQISCGSQIQRCAYSLKDEASQSSTYKYMGLILLNRKA